MTVIHIIILMPCNSAFEYNNDITYYVITRNYQWTPDGDLHKLRLCLGWKGQ